MIDWNNIQSLPQVVMFKGKMCFAAFIYSFLNVQKLYKQIVSFQPKCVCLSLSMQCFENGKSEWTTEFLKYVH